MFSLATSQVRILRRSGRHANGGSNYLGWLLTGTGRVCVMDEWFATSTHRQPFVSRHSFSDIQRTPSSTGM